MSKLKFYLIIVFFMINISYAMSFDSLSFRNEFVDVLSFWENNLLKENSEGVLREMSIDMGTDDSGMLGSMYLSRIIYGSSIACKTLHTDKYMPLADTCFKLLQQQFKNPKGGYFWAKDVQGNVIHSVENANLGQSFVLYGLSEYASLKKDEEIDVIAKRHADFLYQTISDSENGGYIDGFDQDWQKLEEQTKALGTHLHMLEAYTKWYEYTNDEQYVGLISGLVRTIIDHFITKHSYDCIHRLSTDWKVLPNEIWAGHNAECSWILCNSANVIGDKSLIEECEQLALAMMKEVIELAIDKESGGVFNVLANRKPIEDSISWWPPAETVIGLINCYQISGDELYLQIAEKVQGFITNKIVSANGEWYTSVYPDGKVVDADPLIHFWKSMYHNVRYYVEVQNRMSSIQ